MKTDVDVEEIRQLASEAARSGSAAELGKATLHYTVGALSADAGVLALLTENGEELEVVASTGYPVEACMGPGRRWPANSPIPIAEAVHSNEAVRIGSPEEWAQRYAMAYVPNSKSSAWAAIPLRAQGQPLGALLWTYYEPRDFTDRETRLMERLAGIVSEALERVKS